MGLLEVLVLGAYGYTSALAAWFHRKLEKLSSNHIAHLKDSCEKEINTVRALHGLKPIKLNDKGTR